MEELEKIRGHSGAAPWLIEAITMSLGTCFWLKRPRVTVRASSLLLLEAVEVVIEIAGNRVVILIGPLSID